MQILAESQTGKCAYYDDYGNRHLFAGEREHRHHLVMRTIMWLVGYCNHRLV